MPRKIQINYINESGKKCDAVITDAVHHSYYSSKRDCTGRYPKKRHYILASVYEQIKRL